MALHHRISEECTKILLKIENDNNSSEKPLQTEEFEQLLLQKYNKYKQRKASQNAKDILARHDFIALCSITESDNDKPFLFEKTKLSFTIMCSDHCDSNQSEPMINLKQFEKWAAKLYPLATKHNYKTYALFQIFALHATHK